MRQLKLRLVLVQSRHSLLAVIFVHYLKGIYHRDDPHEGWGEGVCDGHMYMCNMIIVDSWVGAM